MKTKKLASKATTRHSQSKHEIKKAHKRALKQARPLHKKILLHPVTVFFLLCSTVLIAGLTYQTLADSYTVTGKVPADPLTQGSQITQPSDGATYNVNQVGLNGTCEYKSYTNLYRNGLFVGVAYCAPDGTFHFTADLLEGANTFLAQAYNITDDIGPVTPAITLTYIKPIPPTPPASSGGGSSTGNLNNSNNAASTGDGAVPLLLSSDFKYKTFITGNFYSWELNVAGGTPPYKATVEWGDGTSSSYKDINGPTFKISHRYKKAGYYAVRVVVVDKNGQTRLIQLAALIHNSGSPDIIKGQTGAGGGNQGSNDDSPLSGLFNLTSSFTDVKDFILVAAPAVGIVALMSFSFWLGERQELAQLIAKSMHGSRHNKTKHRGTAKHRR